MSRFFLSVLPASQLGRFQSFYGCYLEQICVLYMQTFEDFNTRSYTNCQSTPCGNLLKINISLVIGYYGLRCEINQSEIIVGILHTVIMLYNIFYGIFTF